MTLNNSEEKFPKMTLNHTRELDVFYNEHRKFCTNCEKNFITGDCAHLGYILNRQYALLCDNCAALLEETVVRYHWMAYEYEEPDTDDKLWRYMDLAKFISLISKCQLYFSSASNFDDPFEGAKGIGAKKEEWDDFYFNEMIKATLTAPGQGLKSLTPEKLIQDAERLVGEINEIGEKDRGTTFISCWHRNSVESEAMWKIYSNDVTNAIAIQTTAGHLYEAFNKNPYLAIGKVNYIDYNKRFSSVNGAFWYKRKSFEHEQEVRVIIKKHNCTDKGIYMPIDIDKLIDAIYISPYAAGWFREVVGNIIDKYKINKPVLQSEMLITPFY